MNDVANSSLQDASNGHSLTQTLSAGAMLRRAREAAGLHVAALAVSMKVPVKKLEALEADRLDLLPDVVFVRALAASVCRALKIDPVPVLEQLPQTSAPRLNASESGINAPFHVPGQTVRLSIPAFFAKPRVLAVLALLIGAVVVALFPEFKSSPLSADADRAVTPVPAIQVPVVVSQVAPQVSVDAAVPVPVSVGGIPAGAASGVGSVAVMPAEVGKPAVSDPLTLVKSENPAGGSSAGLVVFKAKGPSWVEVTDAKGTVQIRKILSAGESAGASGALPLAVVVGRVDVMDVEVRGKAFRLDGISKDNVARFEVK